MNSGHTVIELISLVGRIAAVIEHGHWYSSAGHGVELSHPDRASLNSIRDELHELARVAAEALTDETVTKP